MCHITFTLHVNDLTVMSGAEGGGGGVTEEEAAKPVTVICKYYTTGYFG